MKLNSKKTWWFGAGLILLLGYFLWEGYSQPGISDVPGDFEEVAFVRNEQNKGGIIRVYAVTVGRPEEARYEQCAELFPTNDHGSTTKIYFFDKTKPYPTSLTLAEPHFDPQHYQAIRIIRRRGAE